MTTKFFKNVALMMTILATMNACSSAEDTESQLDDSRVISIKAIHPSQASSRATETGFEPNDMIGLFVSDINAQLQPYGNALNNGLFTFDGTEWKSSRIYYWNEGTYNVYAYYPWQSSLTDVEEFKFMVSTDQSTHENYTSSDFLYATATNQQAGNGVVNLSFSHILSRANIELVKGEDFEGDFPDNIEVYLHNTVTTANINLINGCSTKDNYTSASTIHCKKISTNKFQAVVVPQRIESRRPLVEVIMGNISYLMEGSLSFRQGYQHTITVTISANPQQAEIQIGGGIANWN